MKTEAVLFTDKGKVEFGDVETPDPGPGDVVVRTTKSWISNGTEGSFLRCERWDGITPWHPALPKPYPMVPGYQKVGVIESVGRNVKGLREGQRVFNTIMSCKGVHSGCGGHMARGPAAAEAVLPLPEDDDPEKYAGLVLTQVGFNGASRCVVEPGYHALVVGDGQVGQWAAQTLQMRGAHVALAGLLDRRLALFSKGPGDLVLNVTDRGWLVQAKAWAGGAFDIVNDTVGNRINLDTNLHLIDSLRFGGTFIATGDSSKKSWMDTAQFVWKDATVLFPCAYTRPRLETVLNLVHEGKLQTQHLITHRFEASEVALAWEKIQREPETTLGVILEWS